MRITLESLSLLRAGAMELTPRDALATMAEHLDSLADMEPSAIDHSSALGSLVHLADLARAAGFKVRSIVDGELDSDAGRVVFCRECSVNPSNDDGDLLCDECT